MIYLRQLTDRTLTCRMPCKRGNGQHPVSFQATFEVKTFTERFNRPAALYLQKQKDDYFVKEGESDRDVSKRDDEEASIYDPVSKQDFCRSLLEKSKNGNSYSVSYEKAFKDVAGDQRWHGKGNSMQNCPAKLRATLCKGKYLDLDIQNCGPTILEQVCEKHEIECPLLSQYNSNREDMLTEFSPYLDRGEAKKLIIRLINGGSVQEHERNEVDGVDWLPRFIQETQKIRRKIAKEYPEIKNRYPATTPNLDSKVMSALLLSLENKVLEQYYHHFKTKGIIKDGQCVLIFDGLMVPDTKRNCEHLTEDFLWQASKHVKDSTGLLLTIRIKPFVEGYLLPADYETEPGNFSVIEAGDDQAAADILIKVAGDRLKKCQGRYLWRHSGCIYREGKQEVEDGIINLTKDVCIVVDAGGGKTSHYAKDTVKMNHCIQRVLADQSIRDDGFVERLWKSNLGYLAFKNGVYSFKERRLLTFKETEERGIYFTHDTGRDYTAEVDGKDTAALMHRVIAKFIPDESKREFFLGRLARAMAGHIEDKWWFTCMGRRNCGKGILCKLLDSAFGLFVQGTNAENLLAKDGVQDAAKAQSWLRPMEFKRLIYTNEQVQVGRKKIDGEMIKRICSNGDYIECRTNHTNEVQIRLQSSFMLFANDFAEVSPADAYQTMIGFKFDNEFHDQSEIDELKERGDAVPATWLPRDETIDEFIGRPEIIDAFTSLVFNAYKPDRQVPPLSVKEDTASIKGNASQSVEERFANLFIRGEKRDVLFYQEIQLELVERGMGKFSYGKIDDLIKIIYSIDPGQPSKENGQGKKQQGRGFSGLKINLDNYN